MADTDSKVTPSERQLPATDAAPEVTRFLQGPQPRRRELARLLRIFVEFLRGFRALHFVGPCVTVSDPRGSTKTIHITAWRAMLGSGSHGLVLLS
jgi:hypothetical protein